MADEPHEIQYESSQTASRADVATVLREAANAVAAGAMRVGRGDDAVLIELPEEVTLEVEVEPEDDEVSLEFELEWPRSMGRPESAPDTAHEPSASPDDGAGALPVSVPADRESSARFEVFRDRKDEWRWRLVHRNGNVIATSGEGYTRKHNAQKGIRSVIRNAPAAPITGETSPDPDSER